MSDQQANDFATQWVNSWNSRQIDSILDHYADTIVFTSPFIATLLNDPNGTIYDKDNLRTYFLVGLQAYPELHFELLTVFKGVNSISLYYRSVNNLLASEMMYFDTAGKITKVSAHYSLATNN